MGDGSDGVLGVPFSSLVPYADCPVSFPSSFLQGTDLRFTLGSSSCSELLSSVLYNVAVDSCRGSACADHISVGLVCSRSVGSLKQLTFTPSMVRAQIWRKILLLGNGEEKCFVANSLGNVLENETVGVSVHIQCYHTVNHTYSAYAFFSPAILAFNGSLNIALSRKGLARL